MQNLSCCGVLYNKQRTFGFWSFFGLGFSSTTKEEPPAAVAQGTE